MIVQIIENGIKDKIVSNSPAKFTLSSIGIIKIVIVIK